MVNYTGLRLLATTGDQGYALVNGTGVVISWTAPADGELHRFTVFATMNVTSGETGGAISIFFTMPDGTNTNFTLMPGGQGDGFNFSEFVYLVTIEPGSTVNISQTSALTGGAAKMWAEIWGS